MKKSKLNIIQNENKITIKKKLDVSNCVIFSVVFLAGILLPIIFGKLRDVPLFWERGLLHQHTLDGLSDIALVVVGGHNDR